VNPVTPDNAGFMVAGYVIALVVYLGYTVMLLRRRRALDRRLSLLPPRPPRPAAPPPPDVAA
jgi:hypothetical protein